MKTKRQFIRFWHSFSTAGLLLGTLFFAFSLTPSLLPRNFLVQGVLSGFAFASGYGIGILLQWTWSFLELPDFRGRFQRGAKLATSAICVAVAAVFLWQAAEWQNSIRELMGLDPVATAHPLKVGLVTVFTFLVLALLARIFRFWFRVVSLRANRYLPRRVSTGVGVLAAFALFWLVADGVVFRVALFMADSSYLRYDDLIEPDREQPTDPRKSGSSASLLKWNELGRAGREFVTTGPMAADIDAFSGKNALEPIRVFVGLRSAETEDERADLALAELERVGGFDRSVLVIVTPTGTGWIDDAAMDGLEYLHLGDVASVALQYSYLSSPISLLIEPDYGVQTARALFRAIYSHWTTLPKEHRPRLYLHGLSLGAMNSERSTDLFEVLADPFHGALWSGPPYTSSLWSSVTAGRDPRSPAWLPRFRDGSFVRFMNQDGAPEAETAAWGPMRVVYLQYASDPVTLFGYTYAFRVPEWLRSPRGPDVSPQLRWYPIVTLLQLTVDMTMATTAPIGYGHIYSPAHYVDAWIEVTGVRNWTAEEIARLKMHLTGQP